MVLSKFQLAFLLMTHSLLLTTQSKTKYGSQCHDSLIYKEGAYIIEVRYHDNNLEALCFMDQNRSFTKMMRKEDLGLKTYLFGRMSDRDEEQEEGSNKSSGKKKDFGCSSSHEVVMLKHQTFGDIKSFAKVLCLTPPELQKKVLESMDVSETEHKLSLVSAHPSLVSCCKLTDIERLSINEDLLTQLETVRVDPDQSGKTRFLMEFIGFCEKINEKVLVFSQYMEPLKLIMSHLVHRFNWKPDEEVLYIGRDIEQKQRHALINEFNVPKSKAKVMLASTEACSQGINLVGASRVILLDEVWNPVVEGKALGCAYRTGQQRIVYTYHLVVKGSGYCMQSQKDRKSELNFAGTENCKQSQSYRTSELDFGCSSSHEAVTEDIVLDTIMAKHLGDIKSVAKVLCLENTSPFQKSGTSLPLKIKRDRIAVRACNVVEENLLEEILAKLPLKSLARFKLVSSRWKSEIESPYFRHFFVSSHRTASLSWSLMLPKEALAFFNCKIWDLPMSLGYYIKPFDQLGVIESSNTLISSSNGLTWIRTLACIENTGYTEKSFVGNPVLQDWVEIPPLEEKSVSYPVGLVTRVDEDGLVSSFKVVRTCARACVRDWPKTEWRLYVYSSETGTWAMKQLVCSLPVFDNVPLNLNGAIYMWGSSLDPTVPDYLVAYDFYGSEEANNQCRVIRLPLPYSNHGRRCLTTSGGDVFYIEIVDRALQVWRLKNNDHSETSERWQLVGEEINMTSAGLDVDCHPMAMNPLDSNIVYLWSLQQNRLVSGNLQTEEFVVHQEFAYGSSSEGSYSIHTHDTEFMEGSRDVSKINILSQFVLPRWMDSVPRPPN